MTEEDNRRAYVGLEEGLQLANTSYISITKDDAGYTHEIIKNVVLKLIYLMRWKSPAFKDLFFDVFWGGSYYDGLKITNPDEFDVDILMRLPEVTDPILLNDNLPGYVNLQLTNFKNLRFENPTLFETIGKFVDRNNFLSASKMRGFFICDVLAPTVEECLSDDIISIDDEDYEIQMKFSGPAVTVGVKGEGLCVLVDLVPCIRLDGRHWPGKPFRANPYKKPEDFFLVPKHPNKSDNGRCWRLSFQKQEHEIIRNRMWMKPTIRIFKRLRDCNEHRVSSYALKTLFLWELQRDNHSLDKKLPELWKGPWSYCLVHMLEVYVKCLQRKKIPYFWNKKLNLLDDLTKEEIDLHRKEVEHILKDIKENPDSWTIIRHLHIDTDELKMWEAIGESLVYYMFEEFFNF